MNRILIVRLDAIGDAVLWCGAMGPLRSLYPDATIGIMCRHAARAIYETCPHIDEVLAVDPRSIKDSVADRDAAVDRLNAWGADVVLHPVRSREAISESVIQRLAAPEKIALASDTANASAEQVEAFDRHYSRIIASEEPHAHELERHGDFLNGLGAVSPDEGEPIRPRLWLTPADHAEAERVMASIGIDPTRTLTLFPTGRWGYKRYPNWCEAVVRAAGSKRLVERVAVMGGEEARAEAEELVGAFADRRVPFEAVNLAGRLTLRGSIALIARSAWCAGTDTFAAHAAAAVGTPHMVLLGGGHFGRFQPYSPLATIACRSLSCYGCDWRCVHARTHCVQDVSPGVVAEALKAMLCGAGNAVRPRVFIDQTRVHAGQEPARSSLPGWVTPRITAKPVGHTDETLAPH